MCFNRTDWTGADKGGDAWPMWKFWEDGGASRLQRYLPSWGGGSEGW